MKNALLAADQVGEVIATLVGYRSLLASAGSVTSPAVQHAAIDLRRMASQLEVLAIVLSQERLEAVR